MDLGIKLAPSRNQIRKAAAIKEQSTKQSELLNVIDTNEHDLGQTASQINQNRQKRGQLVRFAQMNAEELTLVASGNAIYIYDYEKLQIIDTLQGHSDSIIAFDISQIQWNVVSLSKGSEKEKYRPTLIVHSLIDSLAVQNSSDAPKIAKRYQNNEIGQSNQEPGSFYLGRLKWIQTFEMTLERLPKINCLSMSSLGDFFVLGGSHFLSVWCQDQSLDGYTQAILVAESDTLGVDEQYQIFQKEEEVGEIVQIEICGSGRMFATLAENSKTVSVWYRDDLGDVPSENDQQFLSRRFQFAEFERYKLPQHRTPIFNFQFLKLAPNSTELSPSVLLVQQAKKVCIWVEVLEQTGMTFICLQTLDAQLDARFVNFRFPANELSQIDIAQDLSKLFLTYTDTEKRLKVDQENSPHGIAIRSTKEEINRKLDWVLVLNHDSLLLFKLSGLRNVQRHDTSCELFRKIAFGAELGDSNRLDQLLMVQSVGQGLGSILMGQNQNQFTFIGFGPTNNGKLLKMSADLINIENLRAKLEIAMPTQYPENDPLLEAHPDLPLLAVKVSNTQKEDLIDIYKVDNPSDKAWQFEISPAKTNQQTQGRFLIHGSIRMPKQDPLLVSKTVAEMKWVPNFDQLAILTTFKNGSSSVSLHMSSQCVRTFQVAGDLNRVQDFVNDVWSASSSFELQQYTQVHQFEMAQKTKNFFVTKVSIEKPVESNFSDNPVTSSEQATNQELIFAGIDEHGLLKATKLKVEVNREGKINVQQKASSIISAKKFAESFMLTQIVSSQQIIIDMNDNSSKTLILCLAKKEQNQTTKVLPAGRTQARAPVKKPLIRLILLEISKIGKQREIFCIDGKHEELIERPLKANMSKYWSSLGTYLGLLVNQGTYSGESQYLYLYDTNREQYCGHLDLNKILGIDTKRTPCDFKFIENKQQSQNNPPTILIFCQKYFFLLQKIDNNWQILIKQDIKVSTYKHISDIQIIQVASWEEMSLGNLIFVQNGQSQHLTSLLSIINFKNEESIKTQDHFCRQLASQQTSKSVCDPQLLAELYVKGYGTLVAKILLKIFEFLQMKKLVQENGQKGIDQTSVITLKELLEEVKIACEFLQNQSGSAQQAAAPEPVAKPAAKKAFSPFDDLDDSDSDSNESILNQNVKKGRENKKQDSENESELQKTTEQIFAESVDDFLKLLTDVELVKELGLSDPNTLLFVTFVVKIKNILEVDFYSDTLSSQLLRKVFCQTEQLSPEEVQTINESPLVAHLTKRGIILPNLSNQTEQVVQSQNNVIGSSQNSSSKVQEKDGRTLAMEELMRMRMKGKTKAKSSGNIDLVREWTSVMVCQALHSENNDVISEQMAERFDFKEQLNWDTMRKLSIPIWLKDTTRLKTFIEFVAKNEYRNLDTEKSGGTTTKAEVSALWYTMLDKRAVIQKLYSLEMGQEKFAQFFAKDFSQEKTRSIAAKNGMALIAKQKYHLCCAFFFLAQKIEMAVQVALDRCNDPVLGVLLCRLGDIENKSGEITKIADKHFIARGEKFNDQYLISLGKWLKKDYIASVNSLSPAKQDSCLSYLFNNKVAEFSLIENVDSQNSRNTDQIVQSELLGNRLNNADETNSEKTTIYPLVSDLNFTMLDLLSRMKKSPDVKRALHKDWGMDTGKVAKKGGVSSIFDDFMAGASDSGSESEEKKEIDCGPKIEVDERALFANCLQKTIDRRQSVLALILMEENREEFLQQKEDKQKANKPNRNTNDLDDTFDQIMHLLARRLILDDVIGTASSQASREEDTSSGMVNKINAGIDLLAVQLKVNRAECSQFLQSQLKRLGMMKTYVEFQIENATEQEGPSLNKQRKVTQTLQEEMLGLHPLIDSLSRFGSYASTITDTDLDGSQTLLTVLEHFELILDCMMLQSFPNDRRNWPQKNYQQQPQRQQPKGSDYNKAAGDLDDKDTEGVVVESSDEEVARQEIQGLLSNSHQNSPSQKKHRTKPQSTPLQLKKLESQTSMKSGVGDFTPNSICSSGFSSGNKPVSLASNRERLIEEVSSIYRTELTFVTSLFLISTLVSTKFNLSRELANELKMMLSVNAYGLDLDSTSISEEQLSSLKSLLHVERVKILLQKLRSSVKKNVEYLKKVQKEALDEAGGDADYIDYSKFVRRVKSKNVDREAQKKYDFLDAWFRKILISNVLRNIQSKRIDQIRQLQTGLVDNQESITAQVIQQTLFQRSQKQTIGKIVSSLRNLEKSLDLIATSKFKNSLSRSQRNLTMKELHFIIDNRYRDIRSGSLHLDYFFSDQSKLRYFGSFTELHEHFALLKDLQLSLNGIDEPLYSLTSKSAVKEEQKGRNVCYEDRQLEQNQLFYGGIELFKQRQESIYDICFDHCGNDLIAFSLAGKGIREISVVDTLIYRNRNQDGLEVLDEDCYSWAECLHRYEQIQLAYSDLKPKTLPVCATVYQLYSQISISRSRYNSQNRQLIKQVDPKPWSIWSNTQANLFQRAQQYPQQSSRDQRNALFEVSQACRTQVHDESVTALAAHPHLPVYVSGNLRSQLFLWSFNQMNDRSLAMWLLDKDTLPQNAQPKKSTVRKIEFSSFGDKIFAMTSGFGLHVMNFDLYQSSKVDPLFSSQSSSNNTTTMIGKEKPYALHSGRLDDFSVLDGDSLVAVTSTSPKDSHVAIYDILSPPQYATVGRLRPEFKGSSARDIAGGSHIVHSSLNPHRLWALNAGSRTGQICEYDLRKMSSASVAQNSFNQGKINQQSNNLPSEVVSTFQVKDKEEITAVCMNKRQDTLIVGLADGNIKQIDLKLKDKMQEKTLECSEQTDGTASVSSQIGAFVASNQGKKGPVTKLKIHPQNGALFATSGNGMVKLIRTNI